LRGDVKLMVVFLSIKEFTTLVEKVKVMEKLKALTQKRPLTSLFNVCSKEHQR